MSANVSGPKCLCTNKNGVSGGRKRKGRNKKKPNEISRLNDSCLLQIFNRLDLQDLLNLSDVNTQFKRVSEMSFAGRYAKFRYPEDTWHHESRRSQMRRVLCKFGKLIKSMACRDCYPESTELDGIPKFCAGGILEELHLSTKTIMKDSGCARQLFSSLKTLTLNNLKFDAHVGALLSECQELKTLRLIRIPNYWCNSDVTQEYRKLEELYIGHVNVPKTIALLQLNRQIKKLDMPETDATTFAMVSRLVHLEELVLRRVYGVNCYNNISKLVALKSLKVLRLYDVDAELVIAIVKAMENVQSLIRMEYFNGPEYVQQLVAI